MKRRYSIGRLAVWGLLAALLAMTTATLAWMQAKESIDAAYVAVSDFDVEGTLYFNDTLYQKGQDILVEVGLTPGSTNYIGTMRFDVVYTGISPAYIRVRVLEQWEDIATGDLISSEYLPYYTTGAAVNVKTGGTVVSAGGAGDILAEPGVWIDERATDFCYYYSTPVRPKTLSATYDNVTSQTLTSIGDGAIALTLMDQTAAGANNATLLQSIDPNKVRLSLRMEIEAVQPNRFRELFGRESYPKAPAT